MRVIIFCLAAILVLTSFSQVGYPQDSQNKKILFVIASSNFQDEEFFQPKKILEDRGYVVEVASSSKKESKGMLGQKVKPDILLGEVKVDDYAGVVFIGGSGAQECWNNPQAHQLVRQAYQKKKVLGAICIAPVTLANAGILKGKKVTCWPSVAKLLKKKGALYSGKLVEKDGNIITATGPSAARPFGQQLLKALE